MIRWLLLTALVASACRGSGHPSDGGNTTPDLAVACVEDDLSSAGPFAGPGYDPNSGFTEPRQAQYIAHATVIRMSPDPAKQQAFGMYVQAIVQRLRQSPGLIGFQLASSNKCGTGRTLGVWKDTASMYAFVGSPEHEAAIQAIHDFATGGAFTHWTLSADEVPISWSTAMDKLAAAPQFQ